MKRAIYGSLVLVLFVSNLFAYTKPNSYRKAKLVCTNPFDLSTCTLIPSAIVFKEQAPLSPHSWVIPKAIDLLRTDGLQSEADLAQKYLLPMLEGVTFNDVWGTRIWRAAQFSTITTRIRVLTSAMAVSWMASFLRPIRTAPIRSRCRQAPGPSPW